MRRLRLLALLAVTLASAAAAASAPAPVPCRAQEPPPQPAPLKNRLHDQTSPYLRQHAANPVHWQPWDAAALASSRALDKPIFLSVGYSACHWCHVMERECFEDPEIAALLNELFVCIKVDREERPDLDEVYMAAVVAMTGQGGWPLSVWLTPELKPFFGGSYFPPEDQHGLPAFPRVLKQLAKVWRERRSDCEKGASELTQHLVGSLQPASLLGEVPTDCGRAFAAFAKERFDEEHGGFAPPPARAPKFPVAAELMVLLRLAEQGDAEAGRMAGLTLTRMRQGGLFDQLGHGFHRYSTDRRWLVPHFEKMLYDNALLAVAYLEAAAALAEPAHEDTARRVFDWLLTCMQDEAGGFWSSHDADSAGEEGSYFVWRKDEFFEAAGEDAELAARAFGLSAEGNWEGRNVLVAAMPPADAAAAIGVDPSQAGARLERARRALLAARSRRPAPAVDDKILAAWNGLAIAALARGHQRLGEARLLAAAQKAAAFVLGQMTQQGRLCRSWRQGKAQGPAFLEDYAFVADGLLSLFESDGDPEWLAAARRLLLEMVELFGDPADGGLCFTAKDQPSPLVRSKSAVESSLPSGVAVGARALMRAGLLLGDEALFARGVLAMKANGKLLADMPHAAPGLVLSQQFAAYDPIEVVVAGDPADGRTQALLHKAFCGSLRPRVVALVHDGNREALRRLSPSLAEKVAIEGLPTAYVCRRGACLAPVQDPKDLLP